MESIQVELQGQYSTARLHEFLDHQAHTSISNAALVAVSAPLLCLAVMILGVSIPLQPTTERLDKQLGYWYRVFLSVVVVNATTMVQLREACSEMPLPPLRVLLSSLLVGLTASLTVLLLNLKIGFPTPFLCPGFGKMQCHIYWAASWGPIRNWVTGNSFTIGGMCQRHGQLVMGAATSNNIIERFGRRRCAGWNQGGDYPENPPTAPTDSADCAQVPQHYRQHALWNNGNSQILCKLKSFRSLKPLFLVLRLRVFLCCLCHSTGIPNLSIETEHRDGLERRIHCTTKAGVDESRS